MRELVETWQQCTGHGTGRLAAALEITDEALRRSLGMVALPGRIKYGRRYPARTQKTIGVDAGGRIVRALGIPPCEVPGTMSERVYLGRRRAMTVEDWLALGWTRAEAVALCAAPRHHGRGAGRRRRRGKAAAALRAPLPHRL